MKLNLLMAVLALSGAALAKESIVYVSAHPDDSVCGAGTLFLLKDRFDIHIVDVTRGEFGLGEAGFKDGSTAKTRYAEEMKACAMIGAKTHYLDEIDGNAHAGKEPTAKLAQIIREVKPRVIFTHWPMDNHPDHMESYAITRRAIVEAKWKGEFYFHEANLGTQSVNFHPNEYVDITSVIAEKQAFCRAYACQNQGDGLAMGETRQALLRGKQCRPSVPYAEAFATWKGLPAPEGSILRELSCWTVPRRDEVYQLIVDKDGHADPTPQPADRWNAAGSNRIRERHLWIDHYLENTDKTDLPQVLLLGDSIAWGNHYPLRDALKGRAYESVMASSACVGEPILMRILEPVMTTWKFDIVLVNNGLHGLNEYTPEQYGAYLKDYLERIRELQPKAQIVWMRTTPLRTGKDFKDMSPDTPKVLARNAVADKVVAELKIPSIDLYSVSVDHPEYFRDGTHYKNEIGKPQLVKKIVEGLEPYLGKK